MKRPPPPEMRCNQYLGTEQICDDPPEAVYCLLERDHEGQHQSWTYWLAASSRGELE